MRVTNEAEKNFLKKKFGGVKKRLYLCTRKKSDKFIKKY